MFNEAESIPALVAEIEAFRAERPFITEVILVDDGSTDGSGLLIRELTSNRSGYFLIGFTRNFGHQPAITAGLSAVEADAAVVLDADLQDPLVVVDDMVQLWREGYDDVYGIRRQRAGDGWLRRRARHLFYLFFRRFTGVNAPADVGDFRLLSRRVIDAYMDLHEQRPYVRGLVSWLGFNQIGVEYDRPQRRTGRSKYPLSKLARLAFTGLTSFSNRPLRYAVRAGVLVSMLSFAGLVWAVVTKLLYPETISGWASLIFVGFFFGGVQLLFLGIVGTYLGRVYDEVKSRPRFVVRETWQSKVDTGGASGTGDAATTGADTTGADKIGADTTGAETEATPDADTTNPPRGAL